MHSRQRLVVATAAIVVALATAVSPSAATSHAGRTTQGTPASGPALAGTWLSDVTLQDPPPGIAPTFRALDTFSAGGGLIVTSSQAMPVLRSVAQGKWLRSGGRQFASSFWWFRFDASGAYVGMQRVRRTMTLSADGRSFQAVDSIDVLAADGTTVVASLHGTESAVRLTAR